MAAMAASAIVSELAREKLINLSRVEFSMTNSTVSGTRFLPSSALLPLPAFFRLLLNLNMANGSPPLLWVGRSYQPLAQQRGRLKASFIASYLLHNKIK
jgi:hypothetical protein